MTTKGKRNALSAVFVQSVQEMGTYSDGGGLNLRVEDSGTNIGSSLSPLTANHVIWASAEARKAALANARMIRAGRDPLAEKPEAIAARQRPQRRRLPKPADIVVEMRRSSWSNAKHAAQWTSTLTP